ncbi:MAG TPA: hypothetical protein VKG62_06160 [Solirubrobacteraceae bacterium]|nr:hypothetical protein [Solirubrobacteraceae bacterium]
MNLSPVPSESLTCVSCSAPLLADQRYCLSCGQPCSPVRLAFLDVLEGERQASGQTAAFTSATVAYAPLMEPASGVPGWLRRYSGLFAVLSVLLMAMIIGLLVGHWVTQSKAPSAQVVKIEGLGTIASTAATTPASSGGATPAAASSSSKSKSEAEEIAKEEKAEKSTPPPPAPVKVSSASLQKLTTSTGKKHEEEIAKLGNKPIETSGGSGASTPSSSESSKPIGGGSKVESIE